MLYNMKELLAIAKENKFAVPAFNIGSLEILRAVIEVAEETNSPVILEIHPLEIEYLTDPFVLTVKEYAHKSKVPVVIHMDHGSNIYDVMRSIKNGYTSVMIDASNLPYEENVALTKQVVELAHKVNVSVEAEIGTIGAMNYETEGVDNVLYTDPEQAKDFVKRTGIDCLAVAIGTAHGLYPKNFTPKLNLELLKILNKEVNIPLVLHGGSGNPDEEVTASVSLGVSKVNISSDVKSVFFKKCHELLNENPNQYEPCDLFPKCIDEAKKVIYHKLNVLNTIGKANLYK
ncbi:ketose-bisphosphate aldolase [Megamonas funiformis]|uniref:ketose-bisphosphate aldolase n=1 Tax=Megamonas funiformis TaxID=437897 RepID=UPI0024ADC143|nr:ketose-bisphosphate aldolase [Megamonas funiformis]